MLALPSSKDPYAGEIHTCGKQIGCVLIQRIPTEPIEQFDIGIVFQMKSSASITSAVKNASQWYRQCGCLGH